MVRSGVTTGRRVTAAVGVVLTALLGGCLRPPGGTSAEAAAPAAAASGAPPCFDRDAPVTAEERRLDARGPVSAADFVAAGGFEPLVEQLRAALCAAGSVDAAQRTVQEHGADLWRAAVQRAQGLRPMGSIDRYDDRPLYWARLTGTRDLRQWRPSFAVPDAARAELVRTFEYAGRGITSTDFPAEAGVRRVMVSGFDPFQLTAEMRRSNPSGAAALQLDGRVLDAGGTKVRVEAVMLPVLWSAFDAGYVEDAFGPHLRPGTPQAADVVVTISQGRPGRMAIEQWAGAWRGGFPDNADEAVSGAVPAPPAWPRPDPQPEFIETTLPHERMIAAGTRPWPVLLNPGICEWTNGTRPDPSAVTCHDNGPSPDAQAHSGGGGDYLSNESMYRVNRLRTALGATAIRGGHLHVAALDYPADRSAVVSPRFIAERAAVVDQTVALITAAG